MTRAGKASLVVLAVVLALIVGIAVTTLRQADTATGPAGPPQALPAGGAPADDADGPVDPAAALFAPCPEPGPGGGDGPLAGVTVDCLDGSGTVDLGAVVTGRPTVVNLWAYWCAPCRAELPAMAEFAERADGTVDVVAVHLESGYSDGVELLESLGVSLPAVGDDSGAVVAALSAPRVVPVTVLLDAEGRPVATLAIPFDDADDIAEAVSEHLGVTL